MAKRLFLCLMICLVIGSTAVFAGETTLSQNSGTGNAPFFISGEPTLVMNGFDLNSIGIARPAVIDRVSISVQTPVPGTAVDVVVYQDANGGSPSDATLAGTTQVQINSSGTFTATFPTPITVTQPVIWVGFYLPVNFVFNSDTSGTSVLTWWAWTPGGRFDINNLGSAAVLGPADGTAPVNINMNGKARITLEITGAGGTNPQGTPQPVNPNANPAVMAAYPLCANLLWDTADELVSYQDQVNMHCNQVQTWQAPPVPVGYTLRGPVYDVIAFKAAGVTPNRFSVRITHCIRPDAADLDRAVMGSAHGNPRVWEILPTARVGDLVCAEIRYPGNLAYFTR